MTPYFEPRLEQLLIDPMIRLMMASDHISDEDLRRLAKPQRLQPASHRAAPSHAAPCTAC